MYCPRSCPDIALNHYHRHRQTIGEVIVLHFPLNGELKQLLHRHVVRFIPVLLVSEHHSLYNLRGLVIYPLRFPRLR